MKNFLKIKGAPGFEPGTSRSTVESSLIKNALSIHINDGEAIAKIHLCQP